MRRRDLIDLLVAVRARVALVRAQPLDRPQLDPVGERDQLFNHSDTDPLIKRSEAR